MMMKTVELSGAINDNFEIHLSLGLGNGL